MGTDACIALKIDNEFDFEVGIAIDSVGETTKALIPDATHEVIDPLPRHYPTSMHTWSELAQLLLELMADPSVKRIWYYPNSATETPKMFRFSDFVKLSEIFTNN